MYRLPRLWSKYKENNIGTKPRVRKRSLQFLLLNCEIMANFHSRSKSQNRGGNGNGGGRAPSRILWQGCLGRTLKSSPIHIIWAATWENRSSGFPTRSDTKRAVQLLNMARGLKVWIYEVEGLYYPCSENKGADQLCGNRTTDLRLCFRICKNPVFSCRGSYYRLSPKTIPIRIIWHKIQTLLVLMVGYWNNEKSEKKGYSYDLMLKKSTLSYNGRAEKYTNNGLT